MILWLLKGTQIWQNVEPFAFQNVSFMRLQKEKVIDTDASLETWILMYSVLSGHPFPQ